MNTRMNKKIGYYILISYCVLCCLSISCGGRESKITILHTNDMHGHFIPETAGWLDGSPEIGGFKALSSQVSRIRSESENSLFFDAGDFMTGSVLSEMDYEGASGGGFVAMMNRLGYDACVPGNHEFDISAENFKKLKNLSRFDILCANMKNGEENIAKDEYKIYDFPDLKVGVIGLTYHPMNQKAPSIKLMGFDSSDPYEAAKNLIEKIDPLTDLIIVLSHMGIERDKLLAKKVAGIDLIVGGHSHAILNEPEKSGETIIVQTGSNCRNLGVINLTVKDDKVTDYDGGLILLLTENIDPDPALASLVDSLDMEVDKIYGEYLGELKVEWIPSEIKESDVGNFITDALRSKTKSDVAFINSGTIRKRLYPGELKLRDIKELIPFDNELLTFELTGKELSKLVKHLIDAEENLEVSGVDFEWSETEGVSQIKSIKVNGEAINPNEKYKCATIDYVAVFNSKRYFGFKLEKYNHTGFKMLDTVVEAIKKRKIIEKSPGPRQIKISS